MDLFCLSIEGMLEKKTSVMMGDFWELNKNHTWRSWRDMKLRQVKVCMYIDIYLYTVHIYEFRMVIFVVVLKMVGSGSPEDCPGTRRLDRKRVGSLGTFGRLCPNRSAIGTFSGREGGRVDGLRVEGWAFR